MILAGVLVLWLFGERWCLLRRSTREILKAGGLRNLLNLKTLHLYIYKRWTSQYVRTIVRHILPRIRWLSKGQKKWLADHYHAKVLTPELAAAIIANDKEIHSHDLEQVIPYSKARKLLLDAPPDVAVYECACRHTRQDPCQPTQVCMVIGQPFVNFTLEHNPQSSRRISQSEALELLRGEHERGHIHTAWFKDACLDRFFAICNCCKCCCGGIEAMVKYGIPMLAPSGYVARVDRDRCAACGICEGVCPFGAIEIDGKAVVNWKACMGCGVCVGQCPRKAVSLIRDERKGIPLDVRVMSDKASGNVKVNAGADRYAIRKDNT